jgi:hypothetical protein
MAKRRPAAWSISANRTGSSLLENRLAAKTAGFHRRESSILPSVRFARS